MEAKNKESLETRLICAWRVKYCNKGQRDWQNLFVSWYRGSFPYVLLLLGPRKPFVIPITSLHRCSLNRGSSACNAARSTLRNNLFIYLIQFNGVLIQLTGLNRCSGAALASHTFKYLSQLNSEDDMPKNNRKQALK